MINAQTYLDQNYPPEQRGKISELNIANQDLIGHLDLRDFKNLKILRCCSNRLTSLDISNCKKLEEIYCDDNKIEQNLAIFSPLKKLRKLDLGHIGGISRHNNFRGSLQSFSNCRNLE